MRFYLDEGMGALFTYQTFLANFIQLFILYLVI